MRAATEADIMTLIMSLLLLRGICIQSQSGFKWFEWGFVKTALKGTVCRI